jgi:hypothetical protein
LGLNDFSDRINSVSFFTFHGGRYDTVGSGPRNVLGLHQAADIIEKCGIDSETDLSELEQDDFSELESESLLRAQDAKKLKRWCQSCTCSAEKIFILIF